MQVPEPSGWRSVARRGQLKRIVSGLTVWPSGGALNSPVPTFP